mmetsp:Transcript_87377/g.247990  ORF Transcript_87377/g.247990 Transcript_87377/m.247990 type:complete len:545 (+) Transcript_87377:697-2331(+)
MLNYEDMVEEHEYTEDHADEERLFQEMEKVLVDLSNSPAGSPRRLELLAKLENHTSEAANHFYVHLEKEENSALPLIQKVFTNEEMQQLVGDIMGRRPAELMTSIVTMMLRNLDHEESSVMLCNMQQAVAGTYFEKWLAQGQFQWPDESTIKASAQDDEEKAADSYVPVSPTDSNTSSGADAVLDPDSAVPPHPASEGAAEDEAGTGDSSKGGAEDAMARVEHGGRPRSDSTAESVTGWEVNQTNKAVDDDTKTVGMRRCDIEKLFVQIGVLNASAARTASSSSASSPASADGCNVCSILDKCPTEEPATTIDIEALAKAVAATPGPAAAKSKLLQKVQSYKWEMRQKRRRETEEGSGGGGGLTVAAGRQCAHLEDDNAPPSPKRQKSGDSSPRNMMSVPVPDGGGGGGGTGGGRGFSGTFSAAELAPSYKPGTNPPQLGCAHYSRGSKILAPCCGKLWPCRLCHDSAPDRPCGNTTLDMYSVKQMLCMHCGTLQPAAARCASEKCGGGGDAAAAAAAAKKKNMRTTAETTTASLCTAPSQYIH